MLNNKTLIGDKGYILNKLKNNIKNEHNIMNYYEF